MSITTILNNRESSLLAIFGSGLIGGAVIRTASLLCARSKDRKISFDWENPDEIKRGISLLIESARMRNIPRIEAFWCAGCAGFSASEEKMHKEQLSYRVVVAELEKEEHIAISFNLLSSAGGLYEGMSGIVNESVSPFPIRPYGMYKLEQEHILQASDIAFRIYRPTTVYGRACAGSRKGLVSTLIDNTFNQVSTTIHANPDTLRDYLYVGDVARILVLNALLNSKFGETHIIAASRPVPIYYLLERIRLVLGRRPRVDFTPSRGNDQNMSFSGAVFRNLASFTSLEEGVRLLAYQQRSM